MKKNDFDSFLAVIALAGFDAEIKRNEEKLYRLKESVRWEERKQSFRSTLSVILQSANLTRKELNFVLSGIQDAGPDELLEKIRFVSDRINVENDPAKAFMGRCDAGTGKIETYDKGFDLKLATEARKRRKLI